MSPEKMSSMISLVVAIAVLVAGFFQWWDIGFDGDMKTRKWVKILFLICIVFLLLSLILIF